MVGRFAKLAIPYPTALRTDTKNGRQNTAALGTRMSLEVSTGERMH
jgi:hypothetical protein